jgi:ABC-2 type transport system ATP-binding protein
VTPSKTPLPAAPALNRADGAPVVVAQNLTRIFKDFWLRDRARAVDGVSFEVRRGEIFGLLGPNGSGKSTTIKMILGLLKKSRGRLAVFGKQPNDVSIKRRIGYLPEESYLYPFLNARETLDYYAKLFGLEHRVRRRRIDELLDMVGLSGVQHRQVREYSKGMQRRIGIAQALINDPEFLILDEPTTGLDPIGTRQVKDLIIHLGGRGKTILLSSHLLADVEDCVDRMVILYGGKIRAEGTCDELLEKRDRSIIEVEGLDPQTLDEIRGVLQRRSKHLTAVSSPRQRLEDLFIDIVERARADQVATSGAQAGGQTAAFLLGQDQPGAEGSALIDRLLSNNEPEPQPEEGRAAPGRAEPDASVIDGLLSGAGEEAPGERQRRPAPRQEEEVDRSVIEGLLAEARDDARDPDESPGGGAAR